MAMLRRKTKDERRENCVILSGAEGSRKLSPWSVAIGTMMLLSVAAFAAPKSASAYYGDAAFQYIENRLPTAEITCNEGLQYYPNDQKLQMLLDRIHEAKNEQQNENKKNDPKNVQNQDQNNQDQNQDKQNQDQNKDQQNQQNQDQNQNQNGDQSSSSQNDQNQDKQDQGQNGGQSSSSQSQSSDSNGGAGEQPQQPEQSEGNSSDSNGGEPEQQPLAPGEMTPEEAAQLLKDFDEQNGERKPWKPVRGQVRPAKDW